MTDGRTPAAIMLAALGMIAQSGNTVHHDLPHAAPKTREQMAQIARNAIECAAAAHAALSERAAGDPPAVICRGCGSTRTDEQLRTEKAKNPQLISCCPERDALDITGWMARATRLEEQLRRQANVDPASAERHPGPFTGPDVLLARACAMVTIPDYGCCDTPEDMERIAAGGIWNDHIAVQTALTVIHTLRKAASSQPAAGISMERADAEDFGLTVDDLDEDDDDA